MCARTNVCLSLCHVDYEDQLGKALRLAHYSMLWLLPLLMLRSSKTLTSIHFIDVALHIMMS
jgi:hypothetical protein